MGEMTKEYMEFALAIREGDGSCILAEDEADAIAARLKALDAVAGACEEFRDDVLNGVDGLNSDLINTILTMYDDTIGAILDTVQEGS